MITGNNTDPTNDVKDVTSTYDYNLLSGNFTELHSVPEDKLAQSMTSAEASLNDSRQLKGIERLMAQIKSLIYYADALAIKSKCIIEKGTDENSEGLFSFICVRYPSLELDWPTIQRIILAQKTKSVDYQAQKTLELAVTLYISAIKTEIKSENKITD